MPQYWAPRIEPAPVIAMRIMFWTNWIWEARDTAVIWFCSTCPSMNASHAATSESMRLWKAIGAAIAASFP